MTLQLVDIRNTEINRTKKKRYTLHTDLGKTGKVNHIKLFQFRLSESLHNNLDNFFYFFISQLILTHA